VLIAEKNAKGTANIVLKIKESTVLFGLPSTDRNALIFAWGVGIIFWALPKAQKII
jgi:hypothetical protein